MVEFNVGERFANKDCVLAMWTTCPMLEYATTLMTFWGFKYKTVLFAWVKSNKKSSGLYMGMGHHTRSNVELMLLGVKGKGLKRINAGILNAVIAPVESHSTKPDIFREKLVQLYGDVKRIELFARKQVNGWSFFGDEIKEIRDE